MADGSEEVSPTGFESARQPGKAMLLVAVALFLGIAVEVLLYGHPLGVSFLILALLCVGALLGVSVASNVRPTIWGWVLPIPILFFAAMSFLRMEPLTSFLNVVLTLALMALWVRVFRAGGVGGYGWLDYGVALLWVPIESCFRPWSVLAETQRRLLGPRRGRQRAAAVVRGLLMALPVLLVFIVLLSAADLVFGDAVERAVRWINLDHVFDLIGRTLVVVLSGIFLLGAIVAALRSPEGRRKVSERMPLPSSFLGITEALIVLGLVDVLFVIFVGFQFAYLFGGQANITEAGYTYSEYARRGFGELLAVAALSLGMILALGSWSKREARLGRRLFNGLGGLLVGLVGVILTSSWLRLRLYEGAYGFTRLRTYTHAAIPWLGVLFLAFLLLLLWGRLRHFPTAAAAALLGLTVTLNALNVDAFVAKQNISRYEETGDIDLEYLFTLSEDAIPVLVGLGQRPIEEGDIDPLHQMACRKKQLEIRLDRLEWPSLHLSLTRAESSLGTLEGLLEDYYPYRNRRGRWEVMLKGESRPCLNYGRIMIVD